MGAQESRKHHYVPEFLLRAWACGSTLNGYWWDARHRALACKRLGPKAFCRELDLLLLKRHPEGRDTLENKFFGGVDTRGARARDRILEAGPRALSEDERCDVVRLLFSLEVRSPDTIESIRAAVTQLVESMDGDRELLDAMEREGESDAPSDWYAKQLDHTMSDRFPRQRHPAPRGQRENRREAHQRTLDPCPAQRAQRHTRPVRPSRGAAARARSLVPAA